MAGFAFSNGGWTQTSDLKKKADAIDGLISVQSQSKTVSLETVRTQIKPKAGSAFFAQADILISNFREAGKYNRVKSEQSRIDSFKAFLNNQVIAFIDINVLLLNKFRAWLKGTRHVAERTTVNHLFIIRTVYNQAIKAGVIDDKLYPFGKEKIVIKFPEFVIVGPVPDEVKLIEELDLSDEEYLNHARNNRPRRI